jgi:peptidoglycan hydrolase-like protein with peptidoglycan-binding domain
MRNKKTKIFVGISVFLSIPILGLVQTATAANASTSYATTTVTEFMPSFYDDTSALEERKSKLLMMQQMWKGLIPDSALRTITGQSETLAPAMTAQAAGGSAVFTKNLRQGDTDPEVLLLQKALNKNPETAIGTSGAGSSGQETNYFGQKTKTAVIKFQNKYAKEVLIPNGLTAGTGYFGASTRTKMNTLQTSEKSVTTTIPSGSVSGLGEKVKITSIYPNVGKEDTPVTIYGTGFSKSANKIIAGVQTIRNAKSADGTTLSFTMKSGVTFPVNPDLPAASSTYIREHFNEYKTATFPPLKYPVCVINDTGMSNCAFFTVEL